MCRRDLSRYSQAMRSALTLVERMSNPDHLLVPVAPSPSMVETGARAGNVPERVAAAVYRAMVESCQ